MVIKNKKLLSIILIGVASILVGATYFFFDNETSLEKKEDSSNVKADNGNKNLSNTSVSGNHTESSNIDEQKSRSDAGKVENFFPESAYLTVVSLDKAPFSSEKKQELLNKINNLYKYGSLTGGKLTHEFSNLEKYREFLKKHGYDKIEEKVSFSPADLPLNNKSLALTGSYYSGGYTENQGFDSLYRLYESPNGQKLEISQTKLSPDGMKLLIVEETLNYKVNNVFATYETFEPEKTYNIRFVSDGYRYAISTQNLDKNYLLNLANYLTKNQN